MTCLTCCWWFYTCLLLEDAERLDAEQAQQSYVRRSLACLQEASCIKLSIVLCKTTKKTHYCCRADIDALNPPQRTFPSRVVPVVSLLPYCRELTVLLLLLARTSRWLLPVPLASAAGSFTIADVVRQHEPPELLLTFRKEISPCDGVKGKFISACAI